MVIQNTENKDGNKTKKQTEQIIIIQGNKQTYTKWSTKFSRYTKTKYNKKYIKCAKDKQKIFIVNVNDKKKKKKIQNRLS